ncbi:MAG: hypothetical protein IT204_01520 [Fimbriimonadaceae bacterium]|nr:hypothetical protein [Fimbriimonadaceae bacterium]
MDHSTLPPETPLEAATTTAKRKAPVPWWGWLLSASCLGIVIVSMGGALPGALAGGSAAGVATVARRADLSVAARVAICLAITGAAWGIWLALVLLAVSASMALHD